MPKGEAVLNLQLLSMLWNIASMAFQGEEEHAGNDEIMTMVVTDEKEKKEEEEEETEGRRMWEQLRWLSGRKSEAEEKARSDEVKETEKEIR